MQSKLAKWLFPALALTLVACSDDGQEPIDVASVSLAPEGFDVPVSESTGPVPVWQTEAERNADKADRFDVRGDYEDIYGVTAPPATARAVAEFEPTDGIIVDWDDYMSDYMFDLVSGLAGAAPVYIMTDGVNESNSIRRFLEYNGVDTTTIGFFEFTNDAFWTRDYGPIPIAMGGGAPGIVDSEYYPNRRRDDAVPELLGRYFDVPVYRPGLATEGGNFMSNGEGLCVATEWVWQENPGLSRTQIATIKRDYYGCDDFVVLERMAREGTGHVDMFAKFLDEDTVIVGEYSDNQDPTNAEILDRNAQRLANTRLADGSLLEVVRIPMPSPRGEVFRSYTNSLIVNDSVLVPIYPSDRAYESEALAIYRSLMPDHRVVAIDADEVIQIGGAIHCTTMGFNTETLRPANDDRPEPEIDPEPSGEDLYTSTPNMAIRDMGTISDTITVADNGAMGTVVITVDIDHTYVGDLVVALEFNGSVIELQNQAGGNADGIKRSFQLDGSGLDRAGEWTLIVEDRARQDVGTLNGWSIAFE